MRITKKWAVSIGLVVALFLSGTAAHYLSWIEAQGIFNVQATKTVPEHIALESLATPAQTNIAFANRVEPGSAFVLQCPIEIALETLQQYLTVTPDIPYRLEQLQQNRVRLVPVQPLAPGSIFTITLSRPALREQSLSFLVNDRLQVLDYIPGDSTEDVPVNVGILFSFSSDQLTPEAVSDAVTIDPPLLADGTFKLQDGSFIFTPSEDWPEDSTGYLAYDTRYTITLDRSLTSADGLTLGEDFSFFFHTMAKQENEVFSSISFYFKDEYYEEYSYDHFHPDTSPQFPLLLYSDGYDDEYDEMLNEQLISVNVYQYTTTQDYIDAIKVPTYESEGLPLFMRFETHSTKIDSERILLFPKPLPEGYYLVEASIEIDGVSFTAYHLFQSTSFSVYAIQSNNQWLYWLNDALTGEALSGARLTSQSDNLLLDAASDQSGLIEAAPPIELAWAVKFALTGEWYSTYQSNMLFTVTPPEATRAGRPDFVGAIAIDPTPYNTTVAKEHYYAVLYTDRPVYRTTDDTIEIWGLARPRNPKTPMPSHVMITCERFELEQPVSLAANGVFTTQIAFKDLSETEYCSLELIADGETLAHTAVSLEEYVKPTYVLESESVKPFYFCDTDTQASIRFKASTFEGTPVSGLAVTSDGADRLDFSENPSLTQNLRLTDRDGIALLPYPLPDSGDWRPQTYYYQLHNGDAENQTFDNYGDIEVISRDIALRAEEQSNGDVQILTNLIDVSKYLDDEGYGDPYRLIGAPVDVDISIKLYRDYYEVRFDEMRYDPHLFLLYPVFSYHSREELVGELVSSTEDGALTVVDLPQSKSDESYYLSLSTTDLQGRAMDERLYLYGKQEAYVPRSLPIKDPLTPLYSLGKQVASEDSQLSDSDYYFLSEYFEEDETSVFQLENHDKPVNNMKGRLLYTLVQDRFRNTTVIDTSSFSIPFDETLLPNYVLAGAYFDGRTVYALDASQQEFSYYDRGLSLDIQPDRTKYAPGEEITVRVTAKSDDQPAANAAVLLSVVDEAIFELRDMYTAYYSSYSYLEDKPGLLDELYSPIFHPYISRYNSFAPVIHYAENTDKQNMPPNTGGGGPSYSPPRSNFADTGYFKMLYTDEEGVASFSFRLPDNLTSWRLTSLALTPDTKAGDTRENIASTLPYFLQPIYNETIVAGDSFAVSLRSSGTGLDEKSQATYTLEITGNNETIQKTASGGAFNYTHLSVDDLTTGNYTAVIRGTSGEYTDAVSIPFTVAPSALEVSISRQLDLAQPLDLHPLRYPVELIIYNKQMERYTQILSSVYYDAGGSRADERLAARYKAEQLAAQGNAYNVDAYSDRLEDLGNGHLLRMLPYSSLNLTLTCQAHLAMPQLFSADHSELKQFTQSNFDEASILLARAITGEATAQELKTQLGREDFSDDQQLYLACALAVAGDQQAALGLYQKVVTPRLHTLKGFSELEVQYLVQNERGSDESTSDTNSSTASFPDTAAALMAASLCGAPEADALARYLSEYSDPNDDNTYLMERLIYLTHSMQTLPEQAQVQYFSGLESELIMLGRGQRFFSIPSKQLLENIRFSVERGEAWVNARYIGNPVDTADPAKRKLTVSKTIQPVAPGSILPGSLVKIVLKVDYSGVDLSLGDTSIQIDETIPSGFRYESSGAWSPYDHEGQRLRFYAYHAQTTDENGDPVLMNEVVYFARCVLPGSYQIEPAYVSNPASGIWGASVPQMIFVSPAS